MSKLKRGAAIVLGAGIILVVSAGIAFAQTNSSAVTIADFQFTPATMQVPQGTTVTWTNNGPSNHTSTSDSGAWDSGVVQPGKSFSFKFNTPGTFSYHCSIHPSMKGTITVAAAAGASASASPSTAAVSPSVSPASSANASPAASPSASAAPAASTAAASPTASAPAAPTQLPKTGGGGGAWSSGGGVIGGLVVLGVMSS